VQILKHNITVRIECCDKVQDFIVKKPNLYVSTGMFDHQGNNVKLEVECPICKKSHYKAIW